MKFVRSKLGINQYRKNLNLKKIARESIVTGILNYNEINNYLRSRKLVVEPILDPSLQLDAVSIDLRLDHFFAEFHTAKKPNIDPARIAEDYSQFLNFIELECFSDSYYLQPKKFVLAQTFEYISMPNDLVGILDGRSSLARQGLMVHATAGLIDPGFKGHLVFELLNAGEMPLKLYPLMRIAKISFYKTRKTEEYEGQYNLQIRIRPPKNDEDTVYLKKLMSEKSKNYSL